MGNIHPNKSLYGEPIFFVNQKVELLGVIDYRALNRITKPNEAPITRTIESSTARHCQIFSKLDLKSGSHQMLVLPDDE